MISWARLGVCSGLGKCVTDRPMDSSDGATYRSSHRDAIPYQKRPAVDCELENDEAPIENGFLPPKSIIF